MISPILTIDVEEWYHGNYRSLSEDLEKTPSLVYDHTLLLLELLDRYKSKGTFFILGEVAEREPRLVNLIYGRGHEVASHGFQHNLVYEYTPEEFRSDIRRSKQILERITGETVVGYRAPSWSITKKSPWAWRILKEEGFRYSSSVFPMETYLYGIGDALLESHERDGLLEIPMTCARIFGKRIPFSGGFYLRMVPFPIMRILGWSVENAGRPVLYYLHPREIDPEQPRLPLSDRIESFIHHANLQKVPNRLEKILKTKPTRSIRQSLLTK